MLGNLVTNFYAATAMILFGIGFVTLLLQKNLIKKIIGLNIMDTGIFLFLTTKGYITGRSAPIIVDGIVVPGMYVNPLPSALVMTGMVVAVSITAFALALSLKLYEHYGTLDMDKIS
ncbi:MAG: cation:proton antiporter subunit C, partial [Defluviitaleaceae bacterium]|nr:cation:proton antiporter subunit C [Defluviitaleaceae bacterium]